MFVFVRVVWLHVCVVACSCAGFVVVLCVLCSVLVFLFWRVLFCVCVCACFVFLFFVCALYCLVVWLFVCFSLNDWFLYFCCVSCVFVVCLFCVFAFVVLFF